jgi:hypothetical protein
LRDAELKGFGLRVARSGLKTFFLEFRSHVDRRFRRLKLGRYQDLSVDAARTLAKKAKDDILRAPRSCGGTSPIATEGRWRDDPRDFMRQVYFRIGGEALAIMETR